MKEKHYKDQLSALLHDELSPAERKTVNDHLLSCQECRREREEIGFGADLARNLNRADAPDDVWKRIEAELSGAENVRPKTMLGSFVDPRRPAFAALLGTAFLILSAFIYLNLFPWDRGGITENNPKNSAVWQVETLAGQPKIDNSSDASNLEVGGILETDGSSRAEIDVADIGKVEVAPNSLVKLVNSSETEHRLALERGTLEAMIYAPPRLFIVDTPSAVAVDLGCAYRLDVDEEGNSKLHVTSGYVALERDGRESIVPAGAFCFTKRGRGLGTPFFETASPELQAALDEFDFRDGGSAALRKILSSATAEDTLTLWHLISRVSEQEQREKVFEKAVSYVKLPAGTTREGILRLDKQMLEKWREEMGF